jgi:hypothetical protein
MTPQVKKTLQAAQQSGFGPGRSIVGSASTWAYRELRNYFGVPQMYADAVLAHVLEINSEFPRAFAIQRGQGHRDQHQAVGHHEVPDLGRRPLGVGSELHRDTVRTRAQKRRSSNRNNQASPLRGTFKTKDERIDRKGRTVRDLAEKTGLSRATIARHTSISRDEWIQQKAEERKEIRRYHNDEGHSWPETAERFKLSYDTVKRRAYRARKDRAAEAVVDAEKEREKVEPPRIPLEELISA